MPGKTISSAPAAVPAPKPMGRVQLIAPTRTRKSADEGNTNMLDMVVTGVDSTPEDSFASSYHDNKNVAIMEPVFKPGVLNTLVTQNNILSQCVEAMEVNVAGTGFDIAPIDETSSDGEDKEDAEKRMLLDFFSEPFPGKSMITINRAVRTDLESNGNGYLKVIRSADDQIKMIDSMEAEFMRLVRLDDPVLVKKKLKRAGKEEELEVEMRERRFVQILNGKKTFFKEFGASRDLNKKTGLWAPQGKRLPVDLRAAEVIHFTVNKEPRTPYGSPRWINQLPSVLGSRMAEEHNLDFFDAGGLPPVLVMVQGGYLAQGMAETLSAHLGGKGANKHRAAVVEAVASSGSLDSAGSVKVTVERFGSERMQDGMFQQYDKNTEEHVRTSFRLPPMFVGRAQDYNFATAMTGYMVAEAQVFAPERVEFDERINQLCKALGAKKYKYKSKPITLSDVANALTGLNHAITGKIATPESIVSEMNRLLGLKLEAQDPPQDEKLRTDTEATARSADREDEKFEHSKEVTERSFEQQEKNAANDPTATKNQSASKNPTAANGNRTATAKSDDAAPPADYLVRLAEDWCAVLGLGGGSLVGELAEQTLYKVSSLKGESLDAFNAILASKTLVNVRPDLDGLAELAGCAAGLMQQDEEEAGVA